MTRNVASTFEASPCNWEGILSGKHESLPKGKKLMGLGEAEVLVP